MRVLLQKQASGLNYSLESGLAGDGKNFDHHKEEHRCYPSPSNNPAIPVIPGDAIIEISHLDADTFIGLLRMLGKGLPSIDLGLVENLDLNGSSVCKDKFDPTLLYMVGIGAVARELKFPRCGEEPQDVTEIILDMMMYPANSIIGLGREAQGQSEKAYRECKQHGLPLWIVGADDSFDPSRPYEDGYDKVVVYREHYQTISIYCDPASPYSFGGKTILGIPFAGHPKAAGSPRGQTMTKEQAVKVARFVKETHTVWDQDLSCPDYRDVFSGAKTLRDLRDLWDKHIAGLEAQISELQKNSEVPLIIEISPCSEFLNIEIRHVETPEEFAARSEKEIRRLEALESPEYKEYQRLKAKFS